MAPPRRSSRRNHAEPQPPDRVVPAHVRERQRAVAEREAGRLARPEARPKAFLGHADKKKSAVSSTPSGVYHPRQQVVWPDEQQQEWCGPFSVARQMIAQREQAKREAEQAAAEHSAHPLDQAMEELDAEQKRKAHPSMQWKGTQQQQQQSSSNPSLYAKRQKRHQVLQQGRAVPTLFQLCLQFVVENFEHVESLGPIDADVHAAIANQLVAADKLNGDMLPTLLADPDMEALELVDCSGITADELSVGLRPILPQLRYLRLHQCGRCFNQQTVATVVDHTHQLQALSLGGAYLLTDADAARLVQHCAPSALEFRACPQLGAQLCAGLRDAYRGNDQLLELCLEDVPLTEEHWKVLLETSNNQNNSFLRHLKSLSLRRIPGLSDAIVAQLLEHCGPTLEGLDLSDNPQLSDATLAAVRQHCSRLRALTLSALPQLTAAGLEALFTVVPDSSSSPAPFRLLRRLDLSRLDHEAVTDAVLHQVTQSETTNTATTHSAAGLVYLNVQGASLLTDAALEDLVGGAATTLEELHVSFCPRLTDQGLGFLVDRCGRQLARLHVWGNAQLTDDFFDGHRRVRDAGLEIVGVWMKKTASRTIR